MQNISLMFQSATLKLTSWYLVSILVLNIIFSLMVYNFATGELKARFEVIETRLVQNTIMTDQNVAEFQLMRHRQMQEAKANIVTMLLHANVAILAIASIAAYMWARRTLRPIEAAHEAQTRFTSDASHELKTPLTVMKAELELVLHDPRATKKEYREVLASNLEEVERLSSLSTTLLLLAKLEYSKLEWRKFNLTETIDTAIRSLGDRADRIDVSAVKKIPTLEANPSSITELVLVLLDNALKYSPETSRVVLSIKRRGRTNVEISVTNTGKGITEKQLPYIFTRFYRADDSRSHREDGSYGLGLPIAKKIVELHHGELTVTSQPDVFTTFVVRLPLSQSRAM